MPRHCGWTDVRKSFGRTSIINGVNLASARGERHAIIGPNGAGKSTLFNLISGRFRLSAPGASICMAKTSPDSSRRSSIARGLARSFQITNIFPAMSVYENVRCAVLWSLGYKYSFWHRVGALAGCPRCVPAKSSVASAWTKRRDRDGGRAHLRGAARARNRSHHCRRRKSHPARRAHRRHEPQRDRRGGRT